MVTPTLGSTSTDGINISGGSPSAGRDLIGGEYHIAGDNVEGDKVMGDKHVHNYPPPPPPEPPDPNRLTNVPHLWNVPHLQNPNFVGRTADLQNLRRRFDESSRIQSITGLGGIGKTSLTVEYCYQHQDAYDIVWWLRAGESSTLATDYAALAPKLDPALAAVPDVPELVKRVRDYLRQHARWLLIFDNANHPAEIRDYLPPPGAGHILITSRDPNWDQIAPPLALPTLPRADSIQLLTERSGDPDRASAGALAAALGDLPLALEHARAYIADVRISLAAYLDLFRARHADLWRATRAPQNYPSTVATTWDISFQRAAAYYPAAADLLNLCAFFAPDDIPLDVIRDAAQMSLRVGAESPTKQSLPTSFAETFAEPLALNTAVSTLRRYSLVERKDEDLFVHRLVQTVTRDHLSDDRRKFWADAAVKIVDDAYPFDSDDVRTWTDCSRLLQHGLSATTHAETENVAPDQTARLLNQMGLYVNGRAQFADAKKLYERALAIDEKQFGPNHPTVATRVNNLGTVLQDLGDLQGAKAHFARALAIDEKVFGPDHPNVAIRVNNLGNVLQDLGDLHGAKAHFERALAIGEKTLGPDHPNVAIRVNNLGSVLYALGDLQGAKTYLERALAINEKQFGPDHPDVARDVNNLGLVLKDLGDLQGAKAHYERALAIDEKQFGPDHPTVAIRLNNLGVVLQDLGDLQGAKAHYERALAIDEKQFGPDHSNVAIDINNLGMVLQDLGDLQGAKAHYERALEIYRHSLGDDHPRTKNVKRFLDSLS